ncbi:MAG: hypothetical protein WKF67_03330, partial [Rubrobacteraceae bacterium]
RAVTTAEGRGDDYSIADPQVPDLGADLLDDTDTLVAENSTRLIPASVPRIMWRSVPHIALEVSRTIASDGSCIFGS